MRRRSLLAFAGGTLSVGGCLSARFRGTDGPEEPNGNDEPIDSGEESGPNEPDGPGETNESDEPNETDPSEETDGRKYEECPKEIIPYAELPTDVRAEIDAALDGEYEADRVYLGEAMDVEDSYVSFEGEYYEPTIETDADRETLTLRRIEPKALPRPRPVSVEHDLDGERTVEVVVVAEDGTVLLEESRELHPGGVEFGGIRRVGTHEFRVTVSEGGTVEREATDSVRIDESHFDVFVVVDAEGVMVTGTVAELDECRYDD